MDDAKTKQAVAEKIKGATSILVTVSNDPSVDALSAALGLTLLLDKLEKHPTAIFSGMIPPAIAFLQPERTFESTTDSLRDFIIALDKEKADHLRYKVEGDLVKIFITPFKTTITSDDLEFSQGDYNVELVIALGVDVKDHLDSALDTHGKILHDAAVITLTAGDQVSNVGTLDWHEQNASSLSEMVANLADVLKKDKSLVDQQVATALLTGIVSATDRFSNPNTTSQVMTTAANLMAAGADQQLIAAKLQESSDTESIALSEPDSELVIDSATKKAAQDSLKIAHEKNETLEEMDERVRADDEPDTQPEPDTTASHAYALSDASEQAPQTDTPSLGEVHSSTEAPLHTPEPSFGGTLNATADQAADDKRRELENDQNKTILKHTYVGSGPAEASMSGATLAEAAENVPDPLGGASASINPVYAMSDAPAPEPQVAQPVTPPVAVGGERVINPLPSASAPAPGLATPAELGLPMPPPLPDFSQQPPMPADVSAAYAPPAPAQPEILGDILAPEPTQATAPATVPSNDPSQFKIPGQP